MLTTLPHCPECDIPLRPKKHRSAYMECPKCSKAIMPIDAKHKIPDLLYSADWPVTSTVVTPIGITLAGEGGLYDATESTASATVGSLTAGLNNALILIVQTINAGNPSSVTFAGFSMSLINSTNDGSAGVAAYSYAPSSTVSGNAVVTWGANKPRSAKLLAISLTNTSQTPADKHASNVFLASTDLEEYTSGQTGTITGSNVIAICAAHADADLQTGIETINGVTTEITEQGRLDYAIDSRIGYSYPAVGTKVECYGLVSNQPELPVAGAAIAFTIHHK